MKTESYTTSFTVDQSPNEVFHAINNVRAWWSGEIQGDTRVVWHVIDGHPGFVKDKSEWKGTDVVFEIVKKGDKTELRFTHLGLVPAFECYGDCSGAWSFYINDSLPGLI